MVRVGNRWQTGPGTPAAERTAGEALSADGPRRDRELLEEYHARAGRAAPEWTEAVVHANFGGWLTPDELAEIGEELLEMWTPYLARLRDPAAAARGRPAGAHVRSRLPARSTPGRPGGRGADA